MSQSTSAFKHLLSFHSSRRSALDPLPSSSVQPSARRDPSNEPIVDTGLPTFSYTVPLVHLPHHQDLPLREPPTFPTVLSPVCFPLLLDALQLCSAMPAWEDPHADLTAKSRKTSCLQTLSHSPFSDLPFLAALPAPLSNAFFAMISANLFRPIPDTDPKLLSGDAEPVMRDNAREHWQLVYPLLSRYFRANPRDPHFNAAFERRVLKLLHSPDGAERELVVGFLHDWVSAFPDREQGVWARMGQTLVEYRQCLVPPYAVPAILAFLRMRFREERADLIAERDGLVRTAIIPLKSGAHLLSYLGRLAALLDFLIELDDSFATELLRGLAASFPCGRVAKQGAYLHWMIATAEKVPAGEFKEVCGLFFGRLGELAVGESSKIAETALRISQNAKLIPAIIDHSRTVFPIMYAAMARAMTAHWRVATQNHAANALRAMRELNPHLFEELRLDARRKDQMRKKSEEDQRKHRAWAVIARKARLTDGALASAAVLAGIALVFGKQTDGPQISSLRW